MSSTRELQAEARLPLLLPVRQVVVEMREGEFNPEFKVQRSIPRDDMKGRDAYHSTLLCGNRRVHLHKVQVAELLLIP